MRIGFLEYLWIAGKILYSNGPIGYRKKQTIRKKPVGPIVHVGAVIHISQPQHAQYRLLFDIIAPTCTTQASFWLFASFCSQWVHLNTISPQKFGDIQETQFSRPHLTSQVSNSTQLNDGCVLWVWKSIETHFAKCVHRSKSIWLWRPIRGPENQLKINSRNVYIWISNIDTQPSLSCVEFRTWEARWGRGLVTPIS